MPPTQFHPVTLTPSPLAGSADEPELNRFCSDRKLTPYLGKVVELISASFLVTRALQWSIQVDPDTGEQCLEIAFPVGADAAATLRSHDTFTEAWLRIIPAYARDSMRLAYYVE